MSEHSSAQCPPPPLAGFKHKELRGKLAIGITANFINRNTAAEAQVAEISGVARIYNQKFFQELLTETGQDPRRGGGGGGSVCHFSKLSAEICGSTLMCFVLQLVMNFTATAPEDFYFTVLIWHNPEGVK